MFDRVHAQHPEITVVGRSLGSGVAIHLAAQRPLARLVLVTPYDSIQALAVRQFPWVPVRWLLQDKYESWRYAADVTAPTRLIEAGLDEVVPAQNTARLLHQFRPGVATLTRIDGAGHNTIDNSPDYLTALQ